MKKSFLILLVIVFTGLAPGVYGASQIYISDLAPVNLVVGETISGAVRVNFSCINPINITATLKIGNASSINLGNCNCENDPFSAIAGIEKNVQCSFNFSEAVPNTPGEYQVIPGISFGAGSIQGTSAIINVFDEPPIPTGNGVENPLATSTVAGLVTTVTNAIYVIAYMLTALFIMVGGFMIITSSGNPEQIMKGRKIVLYTIIAFAVLVAARGIINFILILIDAPTRI
ncbi:pilin [Patescibacteria group bacterium]|nr:pilin [Patescibacteria group bacterium]